MGPYKFYRNYGKHKYERWPRPHESVIDRERDERGPYGHGTIVHIDRENRQVMVKFFSPPEARFSNFVMAYIRLDNRTSDHFWNATLDGIWDWNTPHYIDLNAHFEEAHCDELIKYQFYSFDDLRWSSHVGGVGAWITIGSY